VHRAAAAIASLLVVSRDFAVLRSISSMGASNCWQFETASNAWEAIEKVQSGTKPDLLLLDLQDGDADGMHILRWLHRLCPEMPVVLIGQAGNTVSKEESIRLGARDYLSKPIEDRQLARVIERSLSPASEVPQTEVASDDVETLGADQYFVGSGPAMRRLRTQAALLAEANVPVLILGEGGSGRETTARLIHKLSVRSGFEFAKVSCVALPEDLLERELFGYENHAVTGPTRTKPGKLELCSKGTLLLDEIAELPHGLQFNLLQVIKNKRFVRPGTSAFIESDVRILATSQARSSRALAEKGFREDLYQYLSAYTIQVPPLRERREEVSLLSRHFMHRLSRHYGLSPREFSPAIVKAWQGYDWPGNLEELEHFVKRYLMVGEKELAFDSFRTDSRSNGRSYASSRLHRMPPPLPSPAQPDPTITDPKSLRSLLKSVKSEAEKNAIAVALEKTGGNRKAAARLLNVSYRTVLYKIEQYNMIPADALSIAKSNGAKVPEASDRDERQVRSSRIEVKQLKSRG
jgi:two-component system response regulator AtoC